MKTLLVALALGAALTGGAPTTASIVIADANCSCYPLGFAGAPADPAAGWRNCCAPFRAAGQVTSPSERFGRLHPTVRDLSSRPCRRRSWCYRRGK